LYEVMYLSALVPQNYLLQRPTSNHAQHYVYRKTIAHREQPVRTR
jgi:hypothetical protein